MNEDELLTRFLPKPDVIVRVAKSDISLYPVLELDALPAERAYAFTINKNAIETVSADARLKLDVLGTQLNQAAFIDGAKQQLLSHWRSSWIDMGFLSIVSFHDSTGAVMLNACTAADPKILLPCAAGIIANCRPPDVRFVRLQLELDFAPVCPGATGNTILRAMYYLELPQTSVDLANGAGVIRSLVTFHGTADIRTLSVLGIRNEIIEQGPYDGPIDLSAAPDFATEATVDDEAIETAIIKKIFRIGFSPIIRAVFINLCPNFSDKPQANVENVSMSVVDPDGNNIVLSVNNYNVCFWGAIRTFMFEDTWPIDCAAQFMKGLHTDLRKKVEAAYPTWHQQHPRDALSQRTALAVLLRHATRAELELESMKGLVIRVTGAVSTARGYPSQAEKTIEKYDGGKTAGKNNRRGKKPNECFGCGSLEHVFSRNGKTLCPRAHEPAIKARADAKFKEIANRPGKVTDSQERWRKKSPNLSDFSGESLKKITNQVYAAEADADGSTIDTESSRGRDDDRGRSYYGPNRGNRRTSSRSRDRSPDRNSSNNGNPVVFVTEAKVYSAAGCPKKPLPVPIGHNMPHFKYLFGPGEADGPPSPSIVLMADSCAALNTMSLPFATYVAKNWPHCVRRVYTDKEHNPIFLSGIVQVNQEVVSTALPVAFEFITPYFHRDGSPINLIFACGPNVAVNAIVGIPFLQATGSILDFNDNVIEMTMVDEPPFPIDFRLPSNRTPTAGTHSASVIDKRYQPFLTDLETIGAQCYAKWAEPLGKGYHGTKKLRFSEDEAKVDCKRTKLATNKNDTPTDTSVVSSNVSQSGIPTVGVQMPSFETALAPGDLPRVELSTGYGFGKDQDTRGMA